MPKRYLFRPQSLTKCRIKKILSDLIFVNIRFCKSRSFVATIPIQAYRNKQDFIFISMIEADQGLDKRIFRNSKKTVFPSHQNPGLKQ